MYVLRNKITGSYISNNRYGTCKKDVNLARTFRRRCDASNCKRRLYNPNNFEVLNVKVSVQGLNYKVIHCPQAKNIPPAVFTVKEHAQEYINWATHYYGLHADYFKIEETLDSPSQPKTRPTWDDYFFGICKIVALRSHDAQTKVGCVITDVKHRILGTGYNGFPSGMKDADLPNTRPEKYDWMVHAEANALANCVLRPENGIVYLPIEPCFPCAVNMYQHGIRTVFYIDEYKSMTTEQRDKRNLLCNQTGMKITRAYPNLSWLEV